MRPQPVSISQPRQSSLAVNQVLRNTYFLLSLTLLFSAACAAWAMLSNAQPLGIGIFFLGWFGLYFLTLYLRNSAWGLLSVFAFTGFVGYTLGPILHMYMHSFTNGTQIVSTALGATGFIFLTLSAYVLTTRKDFSFLGGFIAIAIMAAFMMGIGAMVFNLPAMSLLVSGAFVVLCSAYILYTTSAIIHGGETNYIMATISLFVALFNIFISLLQILGIFGGNRS